MTGEMERVLELFEKTAGCPACGSMRIVPWRKGTIDAAGLRPESVRITDSAYGRTWDLARCRDCGHVFADPCPAPEFIGSLYGGVEDPLYDEETEGREKNFLQVLARLETILTDKGRLFDVGAATGILMNLARGRGWDVDGADPSAWAAATAGAKYGLAVREGLFETLALDPESVDAVTMVDFIEHTARPFDAVQKAAEILKPGGVLCLVTPSLRSVAARLAGRKWWHYRPAHLAYFTRRSLDALLGRAGFTVVRRRSYSWTFSAHYLASRKKVSRFLVRNARLAGLLKQIPVKLVLGDSFEIYARKERPR